MAAVEQDGQTIRLKGDLLFATIVPIRARVMTQIQAASSALTVDFSAVERVDSSALSFWLCCEREAKKSGITLEAVQVPKDMMSIARLVGLQNNLH